MLWASSDDVLLFTSYVFDEMREMVGLILISRL
jgi:hypothetical protein